VATPDYWYRLDDPSSVTLLADPPPGFSGPGNYPAAINDEGDQVRFQISTATRFFPYLFRYHHAGTWQQIWFLPAGQPAPFGVGAINAAGDITATVGGVGLIAYGPDGLGEPLAAKLSPACGGGATADRTIVPTGGPMAMASVSRLRWALHLVLHVHFRPRRPRRCRRKRIAVCIRRPSEIWREWNPGTGFWNLGQGLCVKKQGPTARRRSGGVGFSGCWSGPPFSSFGDNDEMMRRLSVKFLLVSLCIALAVLVFAQASGAQPQQDDAELKKLDAMMTFVRTRNAQDYAITAPNGIDEARYVEIGGIEQWITIRGEDRSNPVLLVLHGGPGDATNPWGYAGFRSWLKTFTVIQWDQRGAGRTFGKNGPSLAPTITIERMAQDGIELTELLCKTLDTSKIVLVGHSWGSILGVFMVKARPELFHAFVGTGHVADPARNYAVAYDELLKKAESLGEQRAIRELKEVGPPPYPEGRGYAVQRKWSNLFEGADFFIASMLGLALGAPGYSLGDVNDWIDGQSLSGERLIPQTNALDPTRLGGEFAVPVFVIQGAEDFTTPTSLARSFVNSIRAPRKAFVPIEGGGHFAVFVKSGAFLNELVVRVLPLVKGR
jgi:pimeloyl-ACP methyl ester carboxylesterase